MKQYEVYLVNLDPTIGSEIKKTRPCVIISPDEMNDNINTMIVAPLTTKSRNYPTRVTVKIQNKIGFVVLDQIRTIDKIRIVKKVGILSDTEITKVKETLNEMLVK